VFNGLKEILLTPDDLRCKRIQIVFLPIPEVSLPLLANFLFPSIFCALPVFLLHAFSMPYSADMPE
jgi:hypothetical protein